MIQPRKNYHLLSKHGNRHGNLYVHALEPKSREVHMQSLQQAFQMPLLLNYNLLREVICLRKRKAKGKEKGYLSNLPPKSTSFIPIAGAGVVGPVVFSIGGNPVTVTLTSMLKLVAVGEPGTVGVGGGGVGGWDVVPTEGVGSEIVPDNKKIFHVELKCSTKTKNKTKQKNVDCRFRNRNRF